MGYLVEGPKTVSELQGICETSQSQLSQFLSRMKFEGLVKSERKGKFQYYAVADQRVVQLISEIQNIFCH